MFCLFFALLGLGVGGNLPVDGTIFLECVPSEKRFMLTLVSERVLLKHRAEL